MQSFLQTRRPVMNHGWRAALLGKRRCMLCRVVRPPPAAASPLSTHVSPAHSCVICILNVHLVRIGVRAGGMGSSSLLHYVTCRFFRKLHNTSHVSTHCQRQPVYLQTFTPPGRSPWHINNSMDLIAFGMGGEKKMKKRKIIRIIIASEVNY